MEFKKELLQNLASGEHTGDFKVVSNTVVDTGRWSTTYSMIFEFDGKFFETSYSKGATEHQDESPYEYEGDEIKCAEVIPVEKTVIVYVKKES